MIVVKSKGSFKNTERFLNAMSGGRYLRYTLEKYGKMGVEALASATPVRTGLTANSWSYEVEITSDSASISWLNSNEHNGVNVAIILQYGHGTGTGGFVAGRDYINPAIQPIFDKIADAVWKEVQSA